VGHLVQPSCPSRVTYSNSTSVLSRNPRAKLLILPQRWSGAFAGVLNLPTKQNPRPPEETALRSTKPLPGIKHPPTLPLHHPAPSTRSDSSRSRAPLTRSCRVSCQLCSLFPSRPVPAFVFWEDTPSAPGGFGLCESQALRRGAPCNGATFPGLPRNPRHSPRQKRGLWRRLRCPCPRQEQESQSG